MSNLDLARIIEIPVNKRFEELLDKLKLDAVGKFQLTNLVNILDSATKDPEVVELVGKYFEVVSESGVDVNSSLKDRDDAFAAAYHRNDVGHDLVRVIMEYMGEITPFQPPAEREARQYKVEEGVNKRNTLIGANKELSDKALARGNLFLVSESDLAHLCFIIFNLKFLIPEVHEMFIKGSTFESKTLLAKARSINMDLGSTPSVMRKVLGVSEADSIRITLFLCSIFAANLGLLQEYFDIGFYKSEE